MVDQAEFNVGVRVRSIRESRGVSLRALADLSGLSANAISLIERGESSPTISSLQRLAAALEVPLTALLEEEHKQTTVFTSPEVRLRSQVDGLELESLGIGLRNQQLEPFLFTVEAGADKLDGPVSHPGEEFVHCLEGEIEYCVGEQIYRLDAGCSLLFEATRPHCFRNRTESRARLLVVFLAVGGAQHVARQRHLDG